MEQKNTSPVAVKHSDHDKGVKQFLLVVGVYWARSAT